MPFRFLPLLLLISISQAENRTWTSADGKSTFEGKFLSHDTKMVTVLQPNDREITFNINKLSQNDRNWLAINGSSKGEDEPDPAAVFDTLCFGDDRKQVESKLKVSKLVETTHDETFFGRLGLNGVFRTKQKIGGLHCELYFDWTPSGRLKEISLQTQPVGAETYDDQLRTNWKELSSLLISLHGKPLQVAGYPDLDKLENDVFLGSHLWRINGGGSALLGTSMQANNYMVVVRFTTEKIEPVRTP
jgi:hypothetical protein